MKKCYGLLILLVMATGAGAQYNFYYGNLHAHSAYSDGNQDSASSGLSRPFQDFNYTKSSFHMDYLGISEHNHYQAGMQYVSDYHQGLADATSTNQDGTFVSLYGMEWGVISGGGHLLIYGVNDLIGWDKEANGITNDYDVFCAKNDYTSLWPIVNTYPGAFITLAHPNTSDYSTLLGSAFSNSANQAITGCAFRSGSAFSTTTSYTDPAPTSYESYYKQLLAKGYHAAPQMDADNHNTTYGRTNQCRTVVLAPSLSRANIMEALRQRRFYASDDWNAQVNFTVSGNFMGADAATYDNSVISVTVNDPDAGDNVQTIQIYYGVPGSGTNATVLTSVTGASTLSFTHPTSFGNKFYYYARITQTDGNIICTAPVWITRSSVFLPVDGLMLTGKSSGQNVLLHWQTQTETNTGFFDVERSSDGQHYIKIGMINSLVHNSVMPVNYNFTDDSPADGVNLYRIRQVDQDGQYRYSQVITVMVRRPLLDHVNLFPNPVADAFRLQFTALRSGEALCRIYNTDAREVKQLTVSFAGGQNNIQLNAGELPAGLYYLILQQPDHVILETSFIRQ